MAFTHSRLVSWKGARQLAFFVTGTIIGCLIPQLLLTGETVVPTAGEFEVAAQNRIISQSAQHVLNKVWNVQPTNAQFNLAQPPKRLGDRRIVRWAKDEVNMADFIKPLLVWTSDEMTRAMSRTWGSDAAKEITMFIPESSSAAIRQSEEVIQLERLGFSSGKQIKTFTVGAWSSNGGAVLLTMAKLCEEFLQSDKGKKQTLAQFRWFVFGHDYTYIRMDALRTFLRTISLAKPLFIAHPSDINYDFTTWSSRTGFILNQKAMSAVCPYVPHCRKFLGSDDVPDDSVLSLCLKAAGVKGSLASDVQKYMVDVRKDLQTAMINRSLSELATLKDGLVFTLAEPLGMHLLFLADKHSALVQLNNHLLHAGQKMKEMDELKLKYPLAIPKPSQAGIDLKASLGNGGYDSAEKDSEIPWYSYDSNFVMSSDLTGRHGQEIINAFSRDIESTLDIACRYCAAQREHFHCLDMVSAHSRFRPSVGVEYRYDLLVKSSRLPAHEASPQRQVVRLVRPLGSMTITELKQHVPKKIHFLLPISQQSAQFQAFMAVYERVVLSKPSSLAALVITCFNVPDEEQEETKESVMEPKSLAALYQHKYPSATISFISMTEKKFDRAAGLIKAAKSVPPDSLLFFAHVDMVFTEQFVERCQLAAEKGKQMYLPVPFYFYQTTTGGQKGNMVSVLKPLDGRYNVSASLGSFQSWARESVCLYRSDLDASGWPGADGTGDELVEKMKHRLQIIESSDPSLAYIWHTRHCSRIQNKAKQTICQKLEAATASQEHHHRGKKL